MHYELTPCSVLATPHILVMCTLYVSPSPLSNDQPYQLSPNILIITFSHCVYCCVYCVQFSQTVSTTTMPLMQILGQHRCNIKPHTCNVYIPNMAYVHAGIMSLIWGLSPLTFDRTQAKLASLRVSSKVINPRRACAARVTVVVLCVCPSVRLSVCLSTTILGLQATRRLMSDTNIFSATRARKINWRFC